MTNAPTGEPQPQWQQPPFTSEPAPAPEPLQGSIVPSSVVVSRGRVAPPSVAETFFGTVAGLIWPVMIVLAIMGVVGWWPAILVAIVASTVLGSTQNHLKARRRALRRAAIARDDREAGLR
ncbi:MAG TPA: hypothetical protein VFK68_01025 [Propionibacteriaceae bacterium]|nr:hypothetical protein [Propionibacteriaceae bacterium]